MVNGEKVNKEKIVDKIVDDILIKVKKRELSQKYNLSSNNLDGDMQQYKDQEKIKNVISQKVEIEEKNDIVKKFIGKKERKSKVIINNDNIGLYLEQDRSDGIGWNVFIKDLSVADNPRMERKKFGSHYKEAENYYGKLFFDYKFNEIKKIDNKDKEKNVLNDVLFEKLNRRGDKKLSLRTTGQILGEDVTITLDIGNDFYYEERTWIVKVFDLDDSFNSSKKDFGRDYNKAKKYFIKLCDDYNLSYITFKDMEIQCKKDDDIFLKYFIFGIIIYVSILILI